MLHNNTFCARCDRKFNKTSLETSMQWPDDVIFECTIAYEQNLHGPSPAWNLFAVEQIGGTVCWTNYLSLCSGCFCLKFCFLPFQLPCDISCTKSISHKEDMHSSPSEHEETKENMQMLQQTFLLDVKTHKAMQ